MTINVNEDMEEGATFEENSQGDTTLRRTFTVTGVDDAVVTDRIISAADAVDVYVDDLHPNAGLAAAGIKVLSKQAKSTSATTFEVACNYGKPTTGTGSSVVDSGSVMEISGTSVEQETNMDAATTPADMTLGTLPWWQYDSTYTTQLVVDTGSDNRPHVWEPFVGSPTQGVRPKDEPDVWLDRGLEWNNDEKSEQNVIAQKYTPIFKLKLSRTETSNPAANVRDYTGKINDSDYTVGGVIWTARKLLCESITSTTDDEGATYSVTYSFLYKFDGWDLDAIYTAEDGMPAADYAAMNTANTDSGSNTFVLYEEEDFDDLDLENASA